MKSIKLILYIGILKVVMAWPLAGNGISDARETVKQDTVIKFGIIADIQYCDGDRSGSRYYRNSLRKLDECIVDLNGRMVQFTVNLGDLVDRDAPHNLDPVLSRLAGLDNPVYNLTGNHDYVNTGDNDRLYAQLGMPGEYYSFRKGDWLFVMLNTNEVSSYTNRGNTKKEAELAEIMQTIEAEKRSNGADYNGGISNRQMRWLERELKKARRNSLNTLIFSHHPLYGVQGLTALNDIEIIELLSKYSDTVNGVISGHHHTGAFGVYEGIPFITVEGMVETEVANAYGVATIYPDKIELEGIGRTSSRTIPLK